jgi:hypothetical protein
MPISVSDLSPVRQKLRNFVSPKVADTVISQTVDTSKITIPEYGTPHPDSNKYPNHLFCYAQPAVDEQGLMFRFYWAAPRENQDDYNWEFTQADIGGTRFDAVSRTYITLRDDFDSASPAMGTAQPNVPVDLFSSSYVLAERKEIRTGDKELDSIFIIDQQVFVKRVDLIQNDFDEFSGRNLSTTQTLYYRGESVGGSTIENLFASKTNSFWGLQSNGTFREGRALSANWFAVSVRDVLPSDFVTSGRTYYTTADYSWPPVLEGIETMDWLLRDGSSRYYSRPYYLREGYSGPCKAQVVEAWSIAPHTLSDPQTMRPLPIVYNSPLYGLSVGACLHGSVTVSANTGNTDPVFDQNAGSERTFAATIPTDWPASIIASDEQQPFRGGYLRKTLTVYRPTTAVP